MNATRGPLRLNAETIDVLADRVAGRVAERLREDGLAATLVSAAEIARRFGVSRDYVYDHAEDFGAVRLGHGRRAPLRFDPRAVVTRQIAGARPSFIAESEENATPRRKAASRVPLLPIREGGGPQTRAHGTGEHSAKNRPHAKTAGLPGGDRG